MGCRRGEERTMGRPWTYRWVSGKAGRVDEGWRTQPGQGQTRAMGGRKSRWRGGETEKRRQRRERDAGWGEERVMRNRKRKRREERRTRMSRSDDDGDQGDDRTGREKESLGPGLWRCGE